MGSNPHHSCRLQQFTLSWSCAEHMISFVRPHIKGLQLSWYQCEEVLPGGGGGVSIQSTMWDMIYNNSPEAQQKCRIEFHTSVTYTTSALEAPESINVTHVTPSFDKLRSAVYRTK